MRILIIKTSSMGDVIHALPAVTELGNKISNVTIDWVVEESFKDIPKYHKYVNKVIPVAIRKWRKNLFCKKTILEIKLFIDKLREVEYDYIIDAQGLLKSVLITRLVKVNKNKIITHGLDNKSARGKYISWLYNKSYSIENKIHAIYRIKLLLSKVFNYQCDMGNIDYGLNIDNYNSQNKLQIINKNINKPYLVFLHCTTWDSKKWPVENWQELIKIAVDNGYDVKLNSGNQEEYIAALQLINGLPDNYINQGGRSQVVAMKPQIIDNLIAIIADSLAVVSVDTGLGHLAAALNKPGVGLFGATNSKLTGFLSGKFLNFQSTYHCSPCLLRSCNKVNNSVTIPPCYLQSSALGVWELLLKNL